MICKRCGRATIDLGNELCTICSKTCARLADYLDQHTVDSGPCVRFETQDERMCRVIKEEVAEALEETIRRIVKEELAPKDSPVGCTMTLEQAIIHSIERSKSDCSNCAKEHKQLGNWLMELQQLRCKSKSEPNRTDEFNAALTGDQTYFSNNKLGIPFTEQAATLEDATIDPLDVIWVDGPEADE